MEGEDLGKDGGSPLREDLHRLLADGDVIRSKPAEKDLERLLLRERQEEKEETHSAPNFRTLPETHAGGTHYRVNRGGSLLFVRHRARPASGD